MIYFYCFARPAATLREGTAHGSAMIRGIDGAEVRVMPLPAVQPAGESAPIALVGHAPSAPSVTAAHLVEHDRVCTIALIRGCDVLPARFGQLFADDAGLTNDYLERAAGLAPLWQRVANAVEMSLAISVSALEPTPPGLPSDAAVGANDGPVSDASAATQRQQGPEADSAGTGYAYLRRVARPIRERWRTRERVEPFRVDLRRSAGELIRGESIRSQSVPSAMGLSHLIDRAVIAAYERVVSEVAVAHPLIRVLLSGPNAPYSFVSLERGS